MEMGDVVKYLPTSTVGKVAGIREQDGKIWVKLDYTNLWYDSVLLMECDPSEYKAVSVKYREVKEYNLDELASDLKKEDVDISTFSPTA